MRATGKILKIIEEKERFEAHSGTIEHERAIALNMQRDVSSSSPAPSIDSELEEYMFVIEEVALNKERDADLQIMEEEYDGSLTLAQAALIRKKREKNREQGLREKECLQKMEEE